MFAPHEIEERAAEAAAFLESRFGGTRPAAAVVLGTGWDGLTGESRRAARVSFAEIPGFTAATAPGHEGAIELVETDAGPLVVQYGRYHRYEGLSSLGTTFPVWTFAALGIGTVVLTAAAGGLNPAYRCGDLIVVKDHIAVWGDNPLTGLPRSAERDRHIIAADFYPERLQEVIRASVPPDARCETGVYAYMTGPSFETEAESTLLRIAGADMVGMSTAPEAIVARYLGMELGAICCISNMILPVRSGGEDVSSLLANVREAVARLEGFLDGIAMAAM